MFKKTEVPSRIAAAAAALDNGNNDAPFQLETRTLCLNTLFSLSLSYLSLPSGLKQQTGALFLLAFLLFVAGSNCTSSEGVFFRLPRESCRRRCC